MTCEVREVADGTPPGLCGPGEEVGFISSVKGSHWRVFLGQ